MRDIAHVEGAVRNAYDSVITARWHGAQHWLFDPTSPVFAPLWRTRRGHRTDLNARNRASHHGPLFGTQPGRDLADAHREVLRLSTILIPELGDYIKNTTTVPAILANRP